MCSFCSVVLQLVPILADILVLLKYLKYVKYFKSFCEENVWYHRCNYVYLYTLTKGICLLCIHYVAVLFKE